MKEVIHNTEAATENGSGTTTSSADAALVQPKLEAGAPDDAYEKEADQMADTVVHMPQENFINQKSAAGENSGSLAGSATPFIQTKTDTAAPAVSDTLSQSIHSTQGSGSSMDGGTQSFMSQRFGADFSQVRIHTDSDAVQMSRELNAKAFTTGNDIYFDKGQYQPQSDSGKHLLAHELTHTIQQGGSEKRVSRAPVTINKRTFNDGNVTLDAKAKTDFLKNGNLLTGKDQGHIAVTGAGKLAYETTYTNPEDPFRWNIVKQMVDNETIEIKAVDSTTDFDSKVVKFSGPTRTRSEAIIKINLISLMAGGITLPTEAQQLKINPTAPLVACSASTTAHHVVYETGAGGRGMLGSNSLAHELFGHLWLAISGAPFEHGKKIAASSSIKDPLGRTFSGDVNDYIANFAGASTSSVLQSPTHFVSPAFLKSSLEWIETNGEAHITTTGTGGIDADLDLQFQIISNNYDILKLGAGVAVDATTTLASSDVETRLVAWAKKLPADKLTAFKNILNTITSYGSNRRSGLAAALKPLI